MTQTHPKKRLIGYARVSTYEQTLDVPLWVVARRRVQQPQRLSGRRQPAGGRPPRA
jgi:hypothetical protein